MLDIEQMKNSVKTIENRLEVLNQLVEPLEDEFKKNAVTLIHHIVKTNNWSITKIAKELQLNYMLLHATTRWPLNRPISKRMLSTMLQKVIQLQENPGQLDLSRGEKKWPRRKKQGVTEKAS